MQKKIEIELICQPNMPSVQANEVAMQILLRNLIDNAIRYIPTNSMIQVKLETRPSHIRLLVEDNGPGIPENMRSRVFERFFRMVGEETKGSGLGLGIVKKIVDLCEAKIELTAPPTGHGLIVCIDFPKREKNK